MLFPSQNPPHPIFEFQSSSDQDNNFLYQEIFNSLSSSPRSSQEKPLNIFEESPKKEKKQDFDFNLPDISNENLRIIEEQDPLPLNDFKKRIDEIEPTEENMGNPHFYTQIPEVRVNESREVFNNHNFYTNSKMSTRRLYNPLLEFIDNPDSKMKKAKNGKAKKKTRSSPKKEYYRTKLIRAWKKLLRKAEKFQFVDATRNPYLKYFLNHYQDNRILLEKIADTATGPKTEAQYRGENNKKQGIENTFNNKFVAQLFSVSVYLESFNLFVFSEFENRNEDELMKRFDFKCCFLGNHDGLCMIKWNKLLDFSLHELLFCNLKTEITQD
jgi:hypothetical protein